jgi:heme oxygenase
MTREACAAITDGGEIDRAPPPALLRDVLRSATAEVHQRLHGHPGFAAVQAGTIDRAAYIALLRRLYGFHRPFEAAAHVAPERTRWLESDLAALGIDAAMQAALPRCAAFGGGLAPDHLLGARYVVEGSSLGGRGMARQLDALLGTGVSAGRRFFSGHGPATGDAWRDYLALLSTIPVTEQKRAAIVRGASATFAIFEQWLDGWNNHHD